MTSQDRARFNSRQLKLKHKVSAIHDISSAAFAYVLCCRYVITIKIIITIAMGDTIPQRGKVTFKVVSATFLRALTDWLFTTSSAML